MLANALLCVALLLAPTHQITGAQQYPNNPYTESSTMGSSLVVNQLAILRMLEDSSNSCSAVPPNFLENLQAKIEQDKHDFHTTITDFLVQMETLKNDSITDIQRMYEVKAAINATKQNVVTMEDKVLEIQTRLDDTNTRLGDMQIHLNDTKTRLHDTRTHMDDTHTRLNDIQERVSIMASAVETTQADLRSSQAKLHQLQDGQNEIKEELGHVSEMNEELNNARNSINTVNTRLNTMEDKVQQTRQAVADVSSRDFLSQCNSNKVVRELTGALTVVASGQYSDGMDCGWEVLVPPGSMILLTWSYLNTEPHDECAYDYVQLQDKAHPPDLLYGKKLCGTELPDDLLVNSHHLDIRFHSDGSNYFTGFLLRYYTFLDDRFL